MRRFGQAPEAAVLWLVFAAAVLVSSTSSADPTREAREHFDRAVRFADRGAFEEALVEFQRAYELKPHPSVLYNIAQTQVALGRPVEAADALERYLRDADINDAKQRAAVEAELARQLERIARISVDVKPPGARIRIDGREVGRAPLEAPVRVRLGTHRVEVTHPGYATEERQIRVAGREHLKLEIELSALEAANARLRVDCPLVDVEIQVDEKLMATTPTDEQLSVTPGRRRIKLHRDGYVPDERTLSIGPDAHARLVCRLVPLRPLPRQLRATLAVRVDQPGAAVLIDGRAPDPGGALPVGRHTVRVSRDGFQTWSREVMLGAGQSQLLEVRLVPMAGETSERTSPGSSTRTLAYVTGGAGVALGVLTAAIYVWNDGRHGDWEAERSGLDAEAAKGPPFPSDLSQRQAENDELLASVQSWDRINLGVGIAAGALLTTGAVLYFTADDSKPQVDQVSARAVQGGGILGWSGTW